MKRQGRTVRQRKRVPNDKKGPGDSSKDVKLQKSIKKQWGGSGLEEKQGPPKLKKKTTNGVQQSKDRKEEGWTLGR